MDRKILMVPLVLLAACQGRDDLDGRRRPIPGLSDRGAKYTWGSDDVRVAWDFYDNRAAAVVHAGGGLTIECGTADVAKYVEGAYRSRWHLAAEDGGRRAALVRGLAGELYVPIDRDPGGVRRDDDGAIQVTVRARAARDKQLVSVFLNEERLGDISMPTPAWKSYTIRAPADTVRDGENKLRFYFRYTGEIDGQRTAAAIERIRLGAPGEAKTPALEAAPVTRGHKRLSALRVSGAARLSYYIQVPAGRPTLRFAAAGSDTEVAVQVAGVRGAARQVWQGQAAPAWTTKRVDLSAWAGQVVRLDLVSAGAVDWGRPQLVVPAGEAGREAKSEARLASKLADHVIVWVVSALRADRLAGAVPTPGFARLAERGLRFASAHTTAPVPAASHVAMLTGRQPLASRITPGAKTLAQRFGEAGYTTALISGNGFVNDEAGFAQGFAIYRNPMRRRHPFAAPILWQTARRLLQRHRDGRTFLYIVTVEPHLPYNPSPESLAAEWDRGPMRFTPVDTINIRQAVADGAEQLSKDEQAYIQALYDAEVRDADAAFARMLADVDDLGIADRTAVILVADHGEELWERGGFGHGEHLHQEVVHVPWIVAAPGVGARVVERDVSLVDLYPTALALAGISAGPQIQGQSVLDTTDELLPRPIFAHVPGQGRSIKVGRYKLIVPEHGAHQLFDLAADPGERASLMGERPIIERYMRNVFGIGVAYQSAWSRSRWGTANNMGPAFAADHGL